MAVVRVEESPEGRDFAFERRGRKTVRAYARSFDVFTDAGGTGQIEVALALGIPRMGDYYQTPEEYDTGAYCERIHPRQQGDNPFHWKVDVSYSSEVEFDLTGPSQGGSGSGGSPAGGGQIVANPLLRRPVVSFTTRVRKVVAEFDYSTPAKAYAAATGERFDPPIEKDVHNLLISIQKNTETYTDDVTNWLDAVNEATWTLQRPKIKGALPEKLIYPKRSARLVKWDAKESEENDIVYYDNHLEIEIQYPNWDLDILNQGSRAFSFTPGTGSTSGRVNVYDDASGVPASGKVLLDKDGVALPDTSVALSISSGSQTVTPKSMHNIAVGSKLIIDKDTLTEEVTVTAIAATTFTAVFANAHAVNSRVIGKPTFITFRPMLQIPFGDITILNPL